MSGTLQDVKKLAVNVLARIENLEDLANYDRNNLSIKEFRFQLMAIHGKLEDAKQATWSVMMKNCSIKADTRKLLGELE